MLASDIPAVLARTRAVLPLGEGQIATVWADGCAITDLEGAPVAVEPIEVDWDVTAAQKGGYDWFMRKEIDEQPDAIRDTLVGRANAGRLALDELRVPDDVLREVSKVFVVACGTAFHSGLVAKYAIEHWTRLPVEIEIASEFRYRDPVLGPDTLTLAVSQSGETIDTLEAARHARRQGSQVIAVTNTVGVLARARGRRRPVHARRAGDRGRVDEDVRDPDGRATAGGALPRAGAGRDVPRGGRRGARRARPRCPSRWRRAIALDGQVRAIAEAFVDARDYLFIGRHTGYPAALEGALKLKELVLHPCVGYPGRGAEARPDRARRRGRAGRGDRDALPRVPEDGVEHPRGEGAGRGGDRGRVGGRHRGRGARGPRASRCPRRRSCWRPWW